MDSEAELQTSLQTESEAQARIYAAIADPARRDLLTRLASRSPQSATQLATQLPITRQGVLKHLQVLKEAGLVQSQKQGKEVGFTLTPEPLKSVNHFVDSIVATWDARLERLKALVEQAQVDRRPQ